MIEQYFIKLGLELVIFLCASFFIFYKAWLKELAKLATIEQLTRIGESIKSDFSKELELYKIKLNEELTLKMEPLKSELAKNNITHQIQLNYLQQERLKIIPELYQKLLELHSTMVDWTQSIHIIFENNQKEEQERTLKVGMALQNFKEFYLPKKIFFKKSLSNYIDEVFKEYWTKGYDYKYLKDKVEHSSLNEEFYKNFTKEMNIISKDIEENLPHKIEELELEFRKMLNVELN